LRITPKEHAAKAPRTKTAASEEIKKSQYSTLVLPQPARDKNV
jgi:hypothetical protein